MLMTLQHLKYAVKVADVSSMNEAAKQLLISQPSLSLQQIRGFGRRNRN